ncbi:MAG: Fic family protein [Eubacteriales bacterium]|nr:Fic family protein [Eubacteriales bacterium]
MENEKFMKQYKKQILEEFEKQDRKGLYAFTQKYMAYNSNKIEGSTLTSEQTASLFDTGTFYSEKDCTYKSQDIEEMNGHFKMFNEILKNLDVDLSIEIIKAFHFQLKIGVFFDKINGYAVGDFKKRINYVSDITTALPQDVPERINNLLAKYNTGNRDLIDMAMFHAEYEHIHPFQDGNGRTGRAILFKQCLDSNIIPVIIKNEDKTKYRAMLHIAQTEGNYEKLYEFFKEQQDKYFLSISNYVITNNENFVNKTISKKRDEKPKIQSMKK